MPDVYFDLFRRYLIVLLPSESNVLSDTVGQHTVSLTTSPEKLRSFPACIESWYM